MFLYDILALCLCIIENKSIPYFTFLYFKFKKKMTLLMLKFVFLVLYLDKNEFEKKFTNVIFSFYTNTKLRKILFNFH